MTSNLQAHPATPDPYADRVRAQWWLVICCTLLMTLGAIDRQVMALLMNPIKADLGLTDTQMSFVYGAAFALAQLSFTLPAGYLADRTSRRILIGVGAVVWSAMTAACGLATSYMQLLLARAGVGFGEGVIGPCSHSMLRSAVAPERRGRAFAVFSASALAGSALALILGGALVGMITRSGLDRLPLIGEVAPWQVVLIVLGLSGIPLALLMATVREPLHRLGHETDAQRGFASALGYMRGRWQVYAPLLGFMLLNQLSTISFAAWLAAMIGRSYGLSIPQIGATVGLMMLVIPPFGLWFTGLALDRAGRAGPAGMAGVGVVVAVLFWLSIAVTPLAPTLNLFWIVLGVHMLFSGGPLAVGASLLATVTPQAMMGKVSSIQLLINGVIAAAIGPIVVAMLADGVFTGPRALAYAMASVTAVYGALAAILMARTWRALVKEGDVGTVAQPA